MKQCLIIVRGDNGASPKTVLYTGKFGLAGVGPRKAQEVALWGAGQKIDIILRGLWIFLGKEKGLVAGFPGCWWCNVSLFGAKCNMVERLHFGKNMVLFLSQEERPRN